METYPRLVSPVNKETGIAGTSNILSITPLILPFSSKIALLGVLSLSMLFSISLLCLISYLLISKRSMHNNPRKAKAVAREKEPKEPQLS